MAEKIIGIGELVPDNANANRGTLRGKGLLHKSFSELGAGRSILIDKNDRIIAGNKSTEAAERNGITEVIVVESTGDEIIAVRRTDLDLDSKKGRDMAIADNTTSAMNIEWDEAGLQYMSEKFGVKTKEWNVATREWGEGYKPVLNPTQQNQSTTEKDIRRAEEKMENTISHHKSHKDTRNVKCPACGYEFEIQKYK